jgi:RNA polymerase sigma-70 factor (ECF subfamily)
MPAPTELNESARSTIESEVVALHQQNAESLLRYAWSIADTEETARDAVQEAFLRYFVERSYGRDVVNPRAWLFQVLRNYLSDRMNSAPARREVPEENLDRHADPDGNPEILAEQWQMARDITASLSGRELECLQLRTEGLSYEEIAGALKLRTGTVGAILTRAYEKIRRRAQGDGASGPKLAAAVCRLVRGGERCIPN